MGQKSFYMLIIKVKQQRLKVKSLSLSPFLLPPSSSPFLLPPSSSPFLLSPFLSQDGSTVHFVVFMDRSGGTGELEKIDPIRYSLFFVVNMDMNVSPN